MFTSITQFLRNLFALHGQGPCERQSGALPYRMIDGKASYLLITSRRSARWMFPKGGIMRGKTPWESAAQEALEEAGIEGEVETTPIGSYRGAMNDENQTPVIVDIYPLRVDLEHDEWREKHQRQRRWVSIEEAQCLLDDPEKLAIATALERRLHQPAGMVRQAAH
ncbi:NUDIX hydrolase [Devosia geojensis]|uniref:NUDIX hydrolase n=1 Tax=Devosia geojensis TaxID=443610 RepID=UPI000695AD87|nr:NUDIX hydrolase [Devosia geojensis]